MAAEVRMGQLTADFGKTAADYGKHRAGFPSELFDRLAAMGIVRAGIRTLDLGTGTGTIARSLAQRGCESTGLDRSALLMEEAQSIDRAASVTVRYVEAAAEDTGFPEASVDLVIAGQCWFWFDRPRAASEARRVVKPGGHLVIAHFDWIPLPDNVAVRRSRSHHKLYEAHGDSIARRCSPSCPSRLRGEVSVSCHLR
jgi:ubiquinone/menaquinone biosynthesis C-methylase UbiE